MRIIKFFVVLAASVMLLSGCDFFRSLVGKPTSKELEQMKQEALEKERKQREQDSLARLRAIELEKAQAEAAKLLVNSSARYHVIIGCYKVEGNAEKMFSLLEQRGYTTPRFVEFNNGYKAVSAASYDSAREAYTAMEEIMETDFCPEDIWVYDLTQNLHHN